MPQTNDKIIRFLVKGNTANVVLATPLDNIIDDVLDAKTLSDHLKANKPLTLTPSSSGTVLVLSIDNKMLCYVAEYENTTYADLISNKGKPIAIKDDNLVVPVSTYFEEYYVKMYAYVGKDIYIYQLNVDNEWSKTMLDNASVVKAIPNQTTFNEIKNADYAYLEGTENWIYSLSEKQNDYIRFVNIENDMRHIWTVTKDDVWTLTDEALCDNKLDKNPTTINVGDNKLVVASNGQIILNTSGELVLNSGTLNGNIDQNVLKNLTKYFPEGNPLLLFAQKQANGFYYANNLNYSLIASFFNGWTTSDGSIKTALNHGIVKIKFGQPTYAEIKAAYDNQAALVGYFNGYLYPVGKSLMSGDNKFYYFGLQDRGTGFACSVYAVTESGWTLEKEFLLNNEYNSTDDIKLQQTAYNAYDVKLVAETLEVEEQ